MKSLKITTLLLAIAMVFGSTSCKYEDGPGLSLRTKKARLAGEWIIEKTIDSDGTEDTDYEGFLATFNKDGTAESSFTYTLLGNTTTSKSTFKWEFTDSKKKLKMTDEDGDVTTDEILRLTNKEFWLKDSDGDATHFAVK